MASGDMIFGDGKEVASDIRDGIDRIKNQWDVIRNDGVIELSEAIGFIAQVGQMIGHTYQTIAVDKAAVKDAAVILYDDVLEPMALERAHAMMATWLATQKWYVRWFANIANVFGEAKLRAVVRQGWIAGIEAGLNMVASLTKIEKNGSSVQLMSIAVVRTAIQGAGVGIPAMSAG